MTKEEQQAINDELAYWNDDDIEVRLDAEYARISKAYDEMCNEESQWQAVSCLTS